MKEKRLKDYEAGVDLLKDRLLEQENTQNIALLIGLTFFALSFFISAFSSGMVELLGLGIATGIVALIMFIVVTYTYQDIKTKQILIFLKEGKHGK